MTPCSSCGHDEAAHHPFGCPVWDCMCHSFYTNREDLIVRQNPKFDERLAEQKRRYTP